jgi:hypothetical protein
VRDDVLYTPPIAASVLPGITRDSVLTLAQDLGLQVKEQDLPREMLYLADEVFFVGTAVEVTPIKSVDKITIGEGRARPVTEALQRAFFDYVNGACRTGTTGSRLSTFQRQNGNRPPRGSARRRAVPGKTVNSRASSSPRHRQAFCTSRRAGRVQ